MKHKLQTLLKHKLQWFLLLAALFGVSQGVWGYKSGCYIVGNWDSWSYWHSLSNTGDEVTIDLANASYEYHFNARRKYDDDSGSHEFGCEGCQKTGSGDVTLYHADNNNYAKLKTTVAGKYKFKLKGWDGNNPIITVTFPSASTDTYDVAGNGTSSNVWCCGANWSANGCAMTGNSSSYPVYKAFSNVPVNSNLQFKVTKNDSWDNALGWSSYSSSKSTLVNATASDAGGNIKLVTTTPLNITVFYDGTNVYVETELACTNPTVTTNSTASSVGLQTATVNGTITNRTCTVSEGGICYSTGSTPTISDSKVSKSYESGTQFSVDLSSLSTGTKYYYCAYATLESGATIYGNIYNFTTTACSAPSSVTSTQMAAANYCMDTDATALEVTGSGGITPYSYQWYSNTTASTSGGSIIDGADDNTYTPPTSTAGDKYYYCVVKSASPCASYTRESSVSGLIHVDATSVAGNITGDGSICNGESKTLGVDGNTGTVTQWKSSTTADGTYSDISGATESTYSASPESTTYYKVVVKNGVCDAVTSSSYATVTVNPAATAAEYPIKSGTDTKSYTGSSQGVTIEPVSGTGTYTVYYTGTEGTSYTKSSTAPTNVGKYSVTVDAQKGTSYCAANNLDVGTLTITAAAPNITMGAISNACGTGDYNISGLASSNSSGAITYSVVGGTGTANINVTTLSVTAVGTITIRARQAASGNYSAGSQDKTFTFAAAPVAGFSASAESTSLTFSNTAYVSTTLSTSANSNWDFQWICDSHPTWGTYNTPTIVSSTSNSTEVRFPIEGVYTFHVGAKCKKDNSYVSSSTVTVTVKLPLCIKGPLTDSNGSWNSYELISNISNSNTRTYSFTAFNKGTNIREFVLDASASGDDKHHIHTSSTVGNLTLTGLDYNSGNDYNLRALESLGISESGTRVVLTITHNGGYYYNLSLALDCTTPEAKTISISASSVCEGESANVIVGSSQSGYIYTVYDSNSGVAGSGTGDGSNLNISVTPSSNTTYTVKAKQGSTCSETAMSNTVSVTVNQRPTFSPASGITQYLPVTVTSDASSPSWTFNKESGSLDGAWLSNTSGVSTVFKAPTGSYTVSDGTCATGLITVSDDTETCD